ncbi:MAG TPA: response regulator, partial [Ramlibacter sp.]|nr:response regulator [Ramlibacter sp.]
MRLLLVEDDAMIAQALVDALRAADYAVDWVKAAAPAEAALQAHAYDLVILDLGLPGRDGIALLRSLRARRLAVPVLVATARDEIASRIAGLDAGADDYLVKPYDTDELLARIRALIRRSAGHAEPAFSHK